MREGPKKREASAPEEAKAHFAAGDPSARRLSPAQAAIRLLKNTKGATAVEFAIVAMPLFLLLFGILELALIFIINTGVNVATATLAKQIRTGEVQAPGQTSSSASSGTVLNRSDAITRLCNGIQIVPLATCIQQLQIDIRPISSFQQTVSSSPVNGSTFNASNLCYYSGNAGDIVEMRAYYLYSFFNPILLAALSNISNYTSGSGSASGKYFLVQNAQVFKTENYSSNSNSGAGC